MDFVYSQKFTSRSQYNMKIMYIDAQNIHKSTQDMWRTIDWDLFLSYSKKKFDIDSIKIFFGYVARYETLYKHLRELWYDVIFKETMILPNGDIKGNVDIDIAIHSVLDLVEWGLQKFYLATGDWDYNTLVDLLRKRGVLWRVLIPHREKASKLLKRSAWPDVQVLEDIRYFIEKKNPVTQGEQDSS